MTESIAFVNMVSTEQTRKGAVVLENSIDATSMEQVSAKIIDWAENRKSRTVILCNVHSTVCSADNALLKKALKNADLVLPDGAPIAWMLRRKGFPSQRRIAGPDLMLKLLDKLNTSRLSAYLFGSSNETLSKLKSAIESSYPGVSIAGSLSPKFGSWTNTQNESYINAINQSGAAICFVGLGCPKQEIWMTENSDKVNGVMLGVGAAFDFTAGTVKRAPAALQKTGFEWLYRLICEPKRLFGRYSVTNSKFLFRAAAELLKK